MKTCITICVLAVSSLGLAGCASTIKASTPRSVVVHGGLKNSTKLAEQECAKHNRYAEYVQERPDFVHTFKCVD